LKQIFIILTIVISLIACNNKNTQKTDTISLKNSITSIKDTINETETLPITSDTIFEQTDYLIKDLDNDNIKDSVYLNIKNATIVCKLSSKEFKEISSKPIEILNFHSGVTETKNGFEFFNDWMRAGYKNQFRYNEKTKKIHLIGMSRYEFGNAANDGSGESSINLLTNDYIGDWNYFDLKKDELVKIPTIKTKMKFKTINLEDFGEEVYFGYAEKCAELYYKHKEKMIKNNYR
jgi:hypothetical protein